jgi:drug/metabolite transporter (DMT)-like permease
MHSATKMAMLLPAVYTLISGTYSAISNKVLYKWKTEGLDHESRLFQKPYFMTLMMFVGEALCLFYKLVSDWQASRKRAFVTSQSNMNGSDTISGDSPKGGLNAPLLDNTASRTSVSSDPANRPHLGVFVILTLFDLSASTLNGVGLIWVSASANQMLRGSMIFFTGVFSVLIFRKNLKRMQWVGIGIVMMGLILVGAAGMLRPSSDETPPASDVFVGILLVLSGSALNSLQNVFEEKLLKGASVDPLDVVGWEGVIGTVLCIFVMLPIVQAIPGSDQGSVENTRDTLMMLTGNAGITIVTLGYSIALAAMNFYSQVVTKVTTAVHRMLISTCRVVLVWMIDLFIYYVIPNGSEYGEFLDAYSSLQFAGFLLLVAGTAVYIRTGLLAAKEVEYDQLNNNSQQA